MSQNNAIIQLPKDEKKKVAYALNLCAVSISQIIDSRDIVVLKQEREFILNNLNLQNFVKHPALLDVLKKILDTITYLEIQAGDLSFVEKEYQQKMKNAIWSAVPSPGAFFAGGDPVTIAIAVATQIGTGYMNYRRNKSQYNLDKEKSIWELKRHELDQLYGLRAQLFETAWNLSHDYDFDDEYRLTERQLSRYSQALLEEDPLKRFERLDVMSEKFAAFPPFWYYKGNAAMEVFRNENYTDFSAEYLDAAQKAYEEFLGHHFELLREDIIASSCCLEYLSILPIDAKLIEPMLAKALRLAGENYDVLQQSVFVNLRLGKIDDVVLSLREMIVNGYNVGLNGTLLTRIYLKNSNKVEHKKLCYIVGEDNIIPWSDNVEFSEKQLIDKRKEEIINEYFEMVGQVIHMFKVSKFTDTDRNYRINKFCGASKSLLRYCGKDSGVLGLFQVVENRFKEFAVSAKNESLKNDFLNAVTRLCDELRKTNFTMQIVEDRAELTNQMVAVYTINSASE